MNQEQRTEIVNQAWEIISQADSINKAETKIESYTKAIVTSYQSWCQPKPKPQETPEPVYSQEWKSVYKEGKLLSGELKSGQWGHFIPLNKEGNFEWSRPRYATPTAIAKSLEKIFPKVGTSRGSLIYAILEACGLIDTHLENGKITKIISPAVSPECIIPYPGQKKGRALYINHSWLMLWLPKWIKAHHFLVCKSVGGGMSFVFTNYKSQQQAQLVYDKHAFTTKNFWSGSSLHGGGTAVWYPAEET